MSAFAGVDKTLMNELHSSCGMRQKLKVSAGGGLSSGVVSEDVEWLSCWKPG